eukprot:2894436-Rhodomonas_salina.1
MVRPNGAMSGTEIAYGVRRLLPRRWAEGKPRCVSAYGPSVCCYSMSCISLRAKCVRMHVHV